MRVVIIGAGVTGLATAWKLCKDHEVVILESRPEIGGIATTFRHEDFLLDSGPHKIYSLIPGILGEMKALLGAESTTIPKTSGVIIAGKRLDYPIKFTDLFLKLSPVLSLKLGFGFGIAFLKSIVVRKKPKTYEEYFMKYFGTPAYNLVFRPIAEKAWGNPKTLDASLARRRVPYNGIFSLVKTMLFKDKKLSAENFYYPRQGFIEMSRIMLEKVKSSGGKIILGARVTVIESADGRITGVVF